MEYVLKTKDITKRYRGQTVLDNVNMNIMKGDIYGFVGENGSGKTTIIRAITGLIYPNSGSFELFGVSNESSAIGEARKRIGAIVETPSIYLNMSAKDNLKLQASLLGVKNSVRIREVLEEVGLGDLYDNKKIAKNFSLGMRQRLGIAMALLGNPEFVILDEPMNGLDPAGIVSVRELILKLNHEKQITFLISSHILTELALVATKYGIISKGHLIKEITNEELVHECRKNITIFTHDVEKLYTCLEQFYAVDRLQITEHSVSLYDEVDYNKLLPEIIDSGVKIENIAIKDIDIESYYLSVLGGEKNA